jgi:2-C-methyl-D-erythritol 4-phosphate cytidylyltransferase/2-C-methyl-D-erythritol 2,4-cyclodiphosphate synthase
MRLSTPGATSTETVETATATARVGAIIPAAGQARRFGSAENKIWATLGGRSVLEWTLAAFSAHPQIACVALVANPEELDRVRAAAAPFNKVTAVTAGGATRTASVRNGLEALPADLDLVLVHDAARPLVSASLIDRIIAATLTVGAAVPGLPLSDTVKRVDAEGLVHSTVPRALAVEGATLSGLTAVQTPQGARISLLRAAYAHSDSTPMEPTDEASLIEAFGAPVAVVPGDPANIKITRQEDLAIAERLGAQTPGNVRFPEIRTGFGYDVHAFSPPSSGRRLFLGGVEIPHDRGLEGHSDADVLLHAVCDALLGAASLGDIGLLFPNTDDAYKGISSLRLLAVVSQRLAQAGWRVVNIDVTVVAEAPKLLPHREAIQRAMAECLGIRPDRISIKATTAEKLGFVGRREGIECSSVATIQAII